MTLTILGDPDPPAPAVAEEMTVNNEALKEQTYSIFGDADSWFVSCWPATVEGRNDGDSDDVTREKNPVARSAAPSISTDEVREGPIVAEEANSSVDDAGGRVPILEESDPQMNSIVEPDDSSRQNSEGAAKHNNNGCVPLPTSVPLKRIKRVPSRKIKPSDVETQRKELMNRLKCAIRLHGRYGTSVADVLIEMAEFYQTLSDYQQAQELIKEGLSIYSARFGDYDPRCIDAKIRTAQLHMLQDELDDAMEAFYQAMDLRGALVGEKHESVMEIRSSLAEVLRRKGQMKEAVKEAKRALKGYREIYGDEHPSVCSVVENIAALYAEIGDHDKANGILAEVVKLRIAINGDGHVMVADALMNWAWSFDVMGNSPKAMKIMKQAYGKYLEIEGEIGSSVLKTLDAIGKVYTKMSQYDKAIKAHTRVLTVKKQTLGNDDLETAASYVAVGCALREIGEAQRAVKCMKRASDVYDRQINGKDVQLDGGMLDSLHQVGLTFESIGNYERSLKAFSNEIALRKKENRGGHQIGPIADVLSTMGLIHCKRGNNDDALDCFTKAMVMIEGLEGRKLKFAETLSNAGLALEQMGRVDDACQAYAEAVLIFKADGFDNGHEAMREILQKLSANGDYQVYIDATNKRLPCSLLDRTIVSF
mmetsp:Transcript_5119/g.14733  ORF Transcript_5119/g.14733 Transcript_5119/m.14733 type:complete len:650 (-) Transcript_5119:68-2017(-)